MATRKAPTKKDKELAARALKVAADHIAIAAGLLDEQRLFDAAGSFETVAKVLEIEVEIGKT